jgi:hypothetical protein
MVDLLLLVVESVESSSRASGSEGARLGWLWFPDNGSNSSHSIAQAVLPRML